MSTPYAAEPLPFFRAASHAPADTITGSVDADGEQQQMELETLRHEEGTYRRMDLNYLMDAALDDDECAPARALPDAFFEQPLDAAAAFGAESNTLNATASVWNGAAATGPRWPSRRPAARRHCSRASRRRGPTRTRSSTDAMSEGTAQQKWPERSTPAPSSRSASLHRALRLRSTTTSSSCA